MEGVAGRYKQYVQVVVRMDADGTCVPLSVVWDDQTTYHIDKVLDVRHAVSRMVDGSGTRYTVRIRHKATYLFREGDRWFVEAKEAALP